MFDYIIVGGGSAGVILATRLTENPKIRVLLLEAGGKTQKSVGGDDYVITKMCQTCDESSPKIQLTRFDVPMYWQTIPWSSYRQFTWKYPDVALGKGLGGSGILNAMIYIRAQPVDFDLWKQMGINGWEKEKMLELYKKTEFNMQDKSRIDPKYHSFKGEMAVSDPIVVDPAFQIFKESAIKAGFKENLDFNGAERDGVGTYPFNIRNGVRDTSLNAVLAPALGRPNLVVKTLATVEKIRFSGGHAVGVEYSLLKDSKKEKKYIQAKYEVIVTAGAINTPKLLLLSGVGPKEELYKLGIDVVADVPGVGKNLHDHMSINLIYKYNNNTYPTTYSHMLGFESQYSWDQTGILATAGLSGGAFMQSPFTENGLADIQFTVNPRNVETNDGAGLSISITQNRPTSRGVLTLKDKNPDSAPNISPIFPQTSSDINSMIWGLRKARDLKNFEPFRSSLGVEVTPGPAYQTDQEITQYLQKKTVLGNHWVGSAKMGNLTDPLTVVDDQLRVRGVGNLRVADGSIMPFVTNGNTHATIMMIGEKASEIILSTWKDDEIIPNYALALIVSSLSVVLFFCCCFALVMFVSVFGKLFFKKKGYKKDELLL